MWRDWSSNDSLLILSSIARIPSAISKLMHRSHGSNIRVPKGDHSPWFFCGEWELASRPKKTESIPPERKGHWQIPLPWIILANVQSLHNKVDELLANVKFLSEHRNAWNVLLPWLRRGSRSSTCKPICKLIALVYRFDWIGTQQWLEKHSKRDCVCMSTKTGDTLLSEKHCAQWTSVPLWPFSLPREIHVTLVYPPKG